MEARRTRITSDRFYFSCSNFAWVSGHDTASRLFDLTLTSHHPYLPTTPNPPPFIPPLRLRESASQIRRRPRPRRRLSSASAPCTHTALAAAALQLAAAPPAPGPATPARSAGTAAATVPGTGSGRWDGDGIPAGAARASTEGWHMLYREGERV